MPMIISRRPSLAGAPAWADAPFFAELAQAMANEARRRRRRRTPWRYHEALSSGSEQ
jgi:hypothetical protein